MTALDAIFIKTAKGQEELQNRTHRLSSRLRSLLLIVDGSTQATSLFTKAAMLGGTENLLQELWSAGFIEDKRGSAPPRTTTPASPLVETSPAVNALPRPVDSPVFSATLGKRLGESKSIMRYCVRNCTGFSDSRFLNKALDSAHNKDELLDCLDQIVERMGKGPQAEMANEMQQRVKMLLS